MIKILGVYFDKKNKLNTTTQAPENNINKKSYHNENDKPRHWGGDEDFLIQINRHFIRDNLLVS